MKSILMPKLLDMQSTENKGAILYCEMLAECSYDGLASSFVKNVMDNFSSKTEGNNEQSKKSLRGSVFEYVIGEVLLLKGLTPLYHQAELRHVPLAKFDWLLYHPKTPVSISCKTSGRERWKQAAYEGMALKRVYSRAVNYFVSIEPLSKTDEKKDEAPGTLDHFIVANTPEFDNALEKIKETNYCEAESVSPIIKSIMVNL
jgi:hypothetical protein